MANKAEMNPLAALPKSMKGGDPLPEEFQFTTVRPHYAGGCTTHTALIGRVHVAKAFTSVQHYEVAAWRTEYMVPEGTYRLYLQATDYYGRREWRVFFKAMGRCTYEYTPAMFGGVAYGSEAQGKEHRDVGKVCERTTGISAQQFHEALQGGQQVDVGGGLVLTVALDDLGSLGVLAEQCAYESEEVYRKPGGEWQKAPCTRLYTVHVLRTRSNLLLPATR